MEPGRCDTCTGSELNIAREATAEFEGGGGGGGATALNDGGIAMVLAANDDDGGGATTEYKDVRKAILISSNQ